MRDDSAHSAGHDASRAMYRWRAYSYDLQLAPYEFLRRHAVERLQLLPGQCVLDLGCGTGMSLELLRQAVGAQGRVIAVDQCPEMIALAHSRVSLAGWTNVELICAAVEDAPCRKRPTPPSSTSRTTSCKARRQWTMCCATSSLAHGWSPPA